MLTTCERERLTKNKIHIEKKIYSLLENKQYLCTTATLLQAKNKLVLFVKCRRF
jgi:hypothetical protein